MYEKLGDGADCVPAVSTATTEIVYAVPGMSPSFPTEVPPDADVKVLPPPWGTAVMMYLTGLDPLLGGMMAMLVPVKEDATVEMVGVRGFAIANLQKSAKVLPLNSWQHDFKARPRQWRVDQCTVVLTLGL